MDSRIAYRGYTFDDVLLEPLYSDILPSQVNKEDKVELD